MEQLGNFDQFYYKADQYNVLSLIMRGLTILEPANPQEELDADAIAWHLAARLGSVDLLRAKFIQDPLRLGKVFKIEDPDFDIADHIFIENVPAPGTYAELAQFAAELISSPMDLSQMWRWTVIDGLEGGKLAIMCNVHHALTDGLGIVEALSTTYDDNPVPPGQLKWETRTVPDEPRARDLLGNAVAQSARRVFVKTPQFLLKNTRPVLSALVTGAKERISNRNNPEDKLKKPEVHRTSLNIKRFSNTASLSWKTLSLPEIKQIAKHFGGTINDIGLYLYAYAMESYFEGIGETIDFDLLCTVPISTRTDDSKAGGNHVAAAVVCLHNTVKDPMARLDAIKVSAAESKKLAVQETQGFNPEELADVLSPIAMEAIFYLAGKTDLLGKLATRIATTNAVFSNVPGPRQPLYIANGLITENIPLIPTIELLALSGGITSVSNAITFGFQCDGEAVKRPELFINGIEKGLEFLRAEMPSERSSDVKKVSRPPKKSSSPDKRRAKSKSAPRAQKVSRPKKQANARRPAHNPSGEV